MPPVWEDSGEMDRRLAITWLGHGTFLLTSPGGLRILIDPWLEANPVCPPEWKRVRRADVILVTHGHADHTDDLRWTARDTGAPVVGIIELCQWLETKGLRDLIPMNLGGTIQVGGVAVTMVPARHTSSVREEGRILYLGVPVGFVLELEDGLTVYFAGDTAVFGDMALIRRLHQPDLAFLPIGDRYTMGPEAAAVACELLGVRQVVPMHYGTYPQLTGTPDRLRQLVEPHGVRVLELKPGQTAE